MSFLTERIRRRRRRRNSQSQVRAYSLVSGIEVVCSPPVKLAAGASLPGKLAQLIQERDHCQPEFYHEIQVRFDDGRPPQTYYVVQDNGRGSHCVGGLGTLFGARTTAFMSVFVEEYEAFNDPGLFFLFKRPDGTVKQGFPLKSIVCVQ